MKILVINGPNLNLLGIREPEIYGNRTYADLVKFIGDVAADCGIEVEVRQTNLQTGKTQSCGCYNAAQVRESLGLSSDGTRLFAKTMNDSLVCYSALSDHPEEIWASAIGYGYDHAPSQVLESRGTVYGSTSSGLIFAVSAADGSILWQHKIGESLVNTVMPVKGGVVATSTDGTVILISDKR